MRGILTVFLCGLLLANPVVATERTFAHVRSDEKSFRALIVEGYTRSPTFKALVDEIESLPGVVYIEPTMKLSEGMEGALLHAVAGSPTLPVLRVLVKGHPAGDRAVALIAHELQHVAEALRARATSSPAAMTRFFESLDAAHTHGQAKLETEGAQRIAEQVLRELALERR
jgi:hypothetical protein